MRQSLFPLAVRLARGDRVALAPAVLASLYRDLREMKAYLVAAGAAATGELLPPLSVYAPLYILQLWVWERFPALWAGKANPVKDGEPRAARWHDMSKKMNPTVVREVLSSGEYFVWQHYTSSVQAWKQHGGWVRGSDVAGNEELRSLAHCLRACELVGIDCIEQYLPHRVAMQFGLDQDVPGDVHRANEDWAVAWETYDLEGKNVAFFIPQSEPGVTARYAHWWRQPLSPSNLDVGAASIAVEWKVSKRKVKKTQAAMEAEAEKERKMKKARISPNDKKRKLEELYDAKLSDWLAAARNGNSGIGGGCKEKPQEAPQAEIVECGEQTILMDNENEQKEVPQTMEEGESAEVEKYLNLAKKDTEEMPMEVAEVEQAEHEQHSVLTKGGAEEEHKEVPEVEHTDMVEPKIQTQFDTEKHAEVEHAEMDGAKRLTGRDADGKPGYVLEVGHAEMEKARVLLEKGTNEKLAEVSEVDHAEVEELKGLIKEGTDKKFEEVPELENIGMGGTHGTMEEDADDKLKKTHGTIEQAEEGQGEVLTGNDKYDYIEKITPVEQVDPKEPTQEQGKEIGKDMMEASNNSISGVMSCNSASIRPEGKQKEASNEGMIEKQCIQGVELANERESSSDAAAMKVKGIDDHKTMGMHEEVAMKMIQDRGTICENKETQILEDSHKLDNRLESDLVILEVDETWDTEGIQNQETLDLDKQQTMEERQDLGTTVEIKKMKISEDANMHGYGEFQTDSPGMEVNDVDSTKGIQNQEHLDIKEEQAMEKTLECGITDGNERPLEEANTLGNGGVDTIAVAMGVSEASSVKGMQNQDACSTEELQAREDKQHQGAANVNEKRILEDTSTIDSCELKSDASVVGVNGAEPREGTQNQWTLSMEKEPAVQGKQDQGMADENTKRILVDMDALECGGVKLDGTMKMAQETLPTGQVVNMAGDRFSSKNQLKGVPWGDPNKSDVEGSESKQTARNEFDGALPPERENQVEVKQEKLENKTEMSIGREKDEASEQDQTTTEDAVIAFSGMDDQGENNKEWTEESIKSYGKYACDSVDTICQPRKFGRPSIEEVRRIHIGRSIYMKDIKESQGRIHSEPSNRIQINNVGYYSRHAIQEPVLASKDIKVPLHDSSRVCGRDHAPELVVTGPPEETFRWRQEQCALQILDDVQNSRIAEKTRMEMEIRILKAQIASMQRQVMNLDHVGEVISRSKNLKRH